jgi:hypothetical protein
MAYSNFQVDAFIDFLFNGYSFFRFTLLFWFFSWPSPQFPQGLGFFGLMFLAKVLDEIRFTFTA